MSYLFHIDEKNRTVLRPFCVKLCPELSALDEQEVLFVIMAYDHFSPLRRYPEKDRVRRAIMYVWRDNKPKLLAAIENDEYHHRINVAIRAYKSLQYDPKIELMNTYQETVDAIRASINPDLKDKDMESKLTNIKNLRKDIQALESEITEAVLEEGQLKGDQDLSYLEKTQKKKELYDYVTKRKK